MEIAVIGVNHKLAPIEIREKVTFTQGKKIKMTEYLKEKGIDEIIILSTCNRSEIYIAGEKLQDKTAWVVSYLQNISQCENLSQYLTLWEDVDAVYHIFKVSCGLDSLVIGEDQILGQVKEAMEFAMKNNTSGKTLNKLFREAITQAKNVKNKYKLSENPTSISYVGIKLLKDKIDTLKDKKVLIIGAGNMGKLSLKYMLEENMDEIYITNRTHNKLNELLNDYSGVIPVLYEQRYEIIKKVDIVISTTASPHTIFKIESMPEISHKLTFLDLALPRDVDREIGSMKNVQLYDIDDLSNIIDKNLEYRKKHIQPIMDIITQKSEEFYEWKKWTIIDPVMNTIHKRCREVEKETLDTIFTKITLMDKDKELIEKMMHSALNKMARQPILNLKQIKDQEKLEDYILMANELFRM